MTCTGSVVHSLHATSHALYPIPTEVSVKKPTRFGVVVGVPGVHRHIGEPHVRTLTWPPAARPEMDTLGSRTASAPHQPCRCESSSADRPTRTMGGRVVSDIASWCNISE